MAFPKKFLCFPIGWKNLGIKKASFYYDTDIKENIERITKHSYCNTRVSIGKQDGELFTFCRLCKIIISDETDETTQQ